MSLRDKCIEAMKATPGPFDSYSDQVEAQLDAVLDVLTEHADELMEAAKDITEQHHDQVPRSSLVPNMTAVSSLLAVLREENQ